MKIIKRDGTTQPFDQNKIIDAVLAAFREVDGDVSDYAYAKAGNIADYILEYCKDYKRQQYEAGNSNFYLTVEEIQDLVQRGLMSTKRKDVAEAYIVYRYERTKERLAKTDLTKRVGEKLRADNVQNQNANVDEHSFGGRKGEAANELMKECKKMKKVSKHNSICYYIMGIGTGLVLSSIIDYFINKKINEEPIDPDAIQCNEEV